MIKVTRRNGSTSEWNDQKIKNAVSLSAMTIGKKLDKETLETICFRVRESINVETVEVEDVHSAVMQVLFELDKDIFNQYKDYHNYKERHRKSFENIKDDTERITYSGDKENANKNSKIISTKKELVSGSVSQEMVLEYELPKVSTRKHKDRLIYIHDLRDLVYDSINCCLFDLGSVIKGGFALNGIEIDEPDYFEAFMDLANDIMMVASSQQFGGFTYAELDKVGAPYLRNTYDREVKELMSYGIDEDRAMEIAEEKTYKIALKKMRMFEYKINCVNNATGQTPFFSVSIGLAINPFAKMIAKAMLEVRMEGMGKNKVTAIFPKIMFLHRKEVNGLPGTPNYELKELAIKCSAKNQYPDYISLDEGTLKEVYDRSGKAITMMGCRAALAPWWNDKGEETYVGRFNIGAVSLLLPRMAILAKQDEEKFFNMLNENFDDAINVLLYRYAKMGKQHASSNPLFFTEGGCTIKCDPNGTIEKALECATASIGYIGLDEACYALSGKHLHENLELAEKIMKFMADKLEDAKTKHNKLFALYGTPAEGLASKALQYDLEDFGVIEGITDKEWYTNSHHVNVMTKISAIEKAKVESVLYKYPTGGRIFYTEWPHTKNLQALEQYINYTMSLGLYVGINFDNGTCHDCGTKGDFRDEVCTSCGSTNVIVINRVCGYLGIFSVAGETRYNNGKKHEVKNRFRHFNYIKANHLEER
jgi:ribonucleoside-triphosphate reductase